MASKGSALEPLPKLKLMTTNDIKLGSHSLRVKFLVVENVLGKVRR